MLQPVFVIIFVQQLYNGVRLVVKSREEFTVIELTHNNKFKEEFTHTAFQEAFREDFVNIQTSSETISYNHSILEM